MYHSVALLSPPYTTLTYARPAFWPVDAVDIFVPGVRVAVPLGKGALRVGIVLGAAPHASLPAGVEIREIVWPLERVPLLSQGYLEMARQLALRQHRSMGDILGHLLPLGIRSTTQARLRHCAGGKPRIYSLKALQNLPEAERSLLAHAFAVPVSSDDMGQVDMLTAHNDAASQEICVLRVDPPWPVRPFATRHIALLEYLLQHGNRTRRAVLSALGEGAAATLHTLLQRGYVDIQLDDSVEDAPEADLLPPPPAPFVLSPAQQEAVHTFVQVLDGDTAQTHLLYGVTGSGKTAVYLELAKACRARGRSVLLLAPEVALACKLARDAQCTLPHTPIHLYHGYQSPARRERLFRQLAAQQDPCVVVGTRSALFLPIPTLGAIVLDEEHDASFKQDENLLYQAKEVAWFLAQQCRALLVLGSATPDMKTFYAARQGHVPLSILPQRVGGGTMPTVRLVDMSGIKNAHPEESILVPESEAALRETLARGEQAVVLLNRRGYAPLMYCLDCHTVARCPHCEIGLTYHKGRERLLCHYCGHTTAFPAPCVQCKSLHYLPMGEGTEKLAEHLAVLAGATGAMGKVLRLDRDSTRRPGRVEEILAAFAREEAQILVGTQMLSKGHHFPNVTLACIADGDLGLNLPDYRAAERTFQLLVQSSGRAGRGEKPGSVIIQTRDAKHYCWEYILRNDFEGFYAAEMERRQRRHYPPFVHLARIRMSFAVDFAPGVAAIQALGQEIRIRGRAAGLMVLGPAPAPLALLRGRKRFHCLLKGQDWHSIRQVYAYIEQQNDKKNVRLSLDLDPVNML